MNQILPFNINDYLISKGSPGETSTAKVKELHEAVWNMISMHLGFYDELVFPESVPSDGPKTLLDYMSLVRHSGNLFRRNNEEVFVNTIRFVPGWPSNLALECISAGTTGNQDISLGAENSLVTDGTALWGVIDIRTGRPELGEVLLKMWQGPKKGYRIANGSTILNVSITAPALAQILSDPVNSWLIKTESEWNALSTAAGGIGGVPYFVYDSNADVVKLPDERDMYFRANVGSFHSDAIRDITGTFGYLSIVGGNNSLVGAFSTLTGLTDRNSYSPSSKTGDAAIQFKASNVVRTASENRTKATIKLPVIYIGPEV